MTVQTHDGLVVIGCGDFGAAAVSHLRERGAGAAPARGWKPMALVTLTGKAATRQQAQSLFQTVMDGGWPELRAALQPFKAPLIALIGAADDAASGGLVVSVLQYLTESKLGRRAVWLALPDGGSRFQARAYATLTELESLRTSAAMVRCFLREVAAGSVELAGMFGEAALAYAQGQPGVGMYAGFGLGAVRDVAELVTRQAAVVAARAIVQQRAASRAHQPAGFGEALMRTADELLREAPPQAWYQERWMPETSSHFVSQCLNEEYAGERLADFLARQLKDLSHYYNDPYSQWAPGVRRRCQRLTETLMAQIREFIETCGTESEAACQELTQALAELAAAMRRASGIYDESHRRCAREYQPLRHEVDEMIFWLNGGAVRTRRPTIDQRQRLVQVYEKMDRKIALGIVDRMRYQELQSALTVLAKEQASLAATLATAGKRQEMFERLHEQVAAWPDEMPPSAPAIHVYPAVPTVESARRVAEAIERSTLVAAMNKRSSLSPMARAEALMNAAVIEARDAVARIPELLPARGEAARERWLTAVKPSLALADPLPQGYKTPSCTYRMGENVPAEIKAELVQQLGVTPSATSLQWLQGDGLLYCETDGFELGCLKALPELHSAYKAQVGQQQGLHVLPEPELGWPGLLPQAHLPRKQLEESAALVVRASLLGLIGPSGDGTLTARYLQEDGQAIHSVSWSTLGEAVRGVAMRKPVQAGLFAQAKRWLARLEEPQLAGYYAVLSHFQWSPMVTPLTGEDARVITKAIADEMAWILDALQRRGNGSESRARAMAEHVGGSEDDFSLPAGEWRSLKW